jgi:starch synthase
MLMQYEQGKCVGILNGIDTDVWDPSTDEFLVRNFNDQEVKEGKKKK